VILAPGGTGTPVHRIPTSWSQPGQVAPLRSRTISRSVLVSDTCRYCALVDVVFSSASSALARTCASHPSVVLVVVVVAVLVVTPVPVVDVVDVDVVDVEVVVDEVLDVAPAGTVSRSCGRPLATSRLR